MHLEVFRGEVVVHLRRSLDQFLVPLFGQFADLGGDLGLIGTGPQGVPVEDGLHADQVDDTLEAVLTPNRQLNGYGIRAETPADHADCAAAVLPRAVPLVYLDEAGAPTAVL